MKIILVIFLIILCSPNKIISATSDDPFDDPFEGLGAKTQIERSGNISSHVVSLGILKKILEQRHYSKPNAELLNNAQESIGKNHSPTDSDKSAIKLKFSADERLASWVSTSFIWFHIINDLRNTYKIHLIEIMKEDFKQSSLVRWEKYTGTGKDKRKHQLNHFRVNVWMPLLQKNCIPIFKQRLKSEWKQMLYDFEQKDFHKLKTEIDDQVGRNVFLGIHNILKEEVDKSNIWGDLKSLCSSKLPKEWENIRSELRVKITKNLLKITQNSSFSNKKILRQLKSTAHLSTTTFQFAANIIVDSQEFQNLKRKIVEIIFISMSTTDIESILNKLDNFVSRNPEDGIFSMTTQRAMTSPLENSRYGYSTLNNILAFIVSDGANFSPSTSSQRRLGAFQ